MPTPIIAGEKAAFVAIVAVINVTEAVWINTNTINYEDLPLAIYRQCGVISEDFLAYPNYLEEAIACFAASDADLVIAGIFVNKVIAGVQTDPLVLINTDISGMAASVQWDMTSGNLLVLGTSSVRIITVIQTALQVNSIDNLVIGGESLVGQLKATATDTQVGIVNIPCLRDSGGELTEIWQDSTIGQVIVGTCATFGGYGISGGGATCALPVLGLAVSNITNVGLELTWVNQSGWLFNYVYYRPNGTSAWILVDTTMGTFVGDTGFIFDTLEADTYYNFRVIAQCVNGAYATPTLTNGQTNCCNSGNQNTTTCEIIALIVASPNPNNLQTLCNGSQIPVEYAAGNTINIPYLQYRTIPTNGVSLNSGPCTATWNMTTAILDNTTAGGFSISDTLVISAVIPN